MKKILFTMMILLGISAFSSNSYETDLVGRMKVLEEKVQVKLDSGVTAEMREGIAELSEAWEKELNTVYSLLMEKLQKKDKIKNILQQMRREGLIITENRIWKLPPKN